MWRACLAAFIVCLAGSAQDAIAGCGDYLLPPVWIAKHQQIPAEYARGRAYGHHNEPPCRGPRCQPVPPVDVPGPTIPLTSFDQDWLATPTASTPSHGRDDVRRQPLSDETSFASERDRLDRPPRG